MTCESAIGSGSVGEESLDNMTTTTTTTNNNVMLISVDVELVGVGGIGLLMKSMLLVKLEKAVVANLIQIMKILLNLKMIYSF